MQSFYTGLHMTLYIVKLLYKFPNTGYFSVKK